MSLQSEAPPTSRQLRYLRALAHSTGTTFETPATRVQASRQITRMRAIPKQPPGPTDQELTGETEQSSYATAVHCEEVEGYGSSATWRVAQPPAPRVRRARSATGAQELARYIVSGGERVLRGERTRGGSRITDRPGSGTGRSYLVERDLPDEEEPALAALIADYLAQARRLDQIPMASGAVREMLGTAGSSV